MAESLSWWRKSARYLKGCVGVLVLGIVTVGTPTLLAILAMKMIQGGIA